VRYLTGAVEILAAVVFIAFGAGMLLGLGGRLTFAGLSWAQRRAKRADRPRERVPGLHKGSGERPTTPRPSFPTVTYPRGN
jgi:hypothetical protein